VGVKELVDLLDWCLKRDAENPSALSMGEQAFKTDLKRTIRIYDWLKYHP